MPEVKKKTSNAWEIITSPLKTDVAGTRINTFPDEIKAGDWPLVSCMGMFKVKSSSLASCGCQVTIPASGTYRIKWQGHSDGDDAGVTHQCAIYKNGSKVGSNYSYRINSDYTPTNFSVDVDCSKGDVIAIYGTATSDWGYYYGHIANLQACIEWNPYGD